MRRAVLRQAAPIVGPYKVGDIVSYCRRPRKEETGVQWSIGSRIVGFEPGTTGMPEATPRSAWVISDGLPVLVATDRLRPCTQEELMAYWFLQERGKRKKFEVHLQQQ